MATHHARLPQRRTAAQRAKADENATSKHLRQPSNVSAGNSRFVTKDFGVSKANIARTALSEVTLAAVNRKLLAGKEKDETTLKRGRSDSTTVAQRVPLAPVRSQATAPVANATHARVPVVRTRIPTHHVKRTSRPAPEPIAPAEIEEELRAMDVEDDVNDDEAAVAILVEDEDDVELMNGLDSSDEEDDADLPLTRQSKPPRVWPEVSTDRAQKYHKEIRAVRETFHEEIDIFDTTMCSEYAEDIFEYMCDLEEEVMPDANYMNAQNEITWAMRQTLVDWLLQVHLRYHMLPETLWIAINIVDRFLTKRVVSLAKLQLVGVTAMFIAAKYEEILAPSVQEFVFMTENGYTKEEILKGERIVLQTLEFRISHYCSPYSWMRKISKADDYDIQTRTLSKFLTEVTLLDNRFLRVKPSLIAAVGMYCARKMLGGDWNDAFVFYSDYTEEQLQPGHEMLAEKLSEENFSNHYVCKKYASKKFLKASLFAIEWAKAHMSSRHGSEEQMMYEE